MDQKSSLRRADFITSLLLVGFGIWVLIEGSQMPMTGTYAGVQSQWYVSPGLLPMIIGGLLSLLGTVLLLNSIRTGGARVFTEGFTTRKIKLEESHVRFAAILLAFASYVYLNIPRVDFFLATATFLLFFVSAFYPNDDRILHKITVFYGISQFILCIVFVTGLGAFLNRVFVVRTVEFGTDIIALLILVALWIYFGRLTRNKPELKKIRQITYLVAFLTPFAMTIIFRYALRVRLPYEGGIVELFHLVYYAIR